MADTDADEPALVQRAQRGDAEAIAALFRRHAPGIFRYFIFRVSDRATAQDLTSEVFQQMLEGLPGYVARGVPFAAWLFRIARSKLMDHFRKSRFEVGLDAAERSVEEGDTLGRLIQDEELSHLKFLIKGLHANEQDLIKLRYVADLSFAEMGELLGKREDSVRKSVNRLMARLRSQME